jgi:ribosomal protein S18 acetylase RimI-like enzyme
VSVIKEYQGYGIASKLLSNTIKYGKNNGFISVALEVNIKNSNAIKLYEKYGFVATELSHERLNMKSIILSDK